MNKVHNASLERVLAKRPMSVIRACLLEILTAVMTAVTTMTGYDHYVKMAEALGREVGSFEQFLLSRGASVLVTLLFAWLFYQGRNWARIFYIVFFCINFSMILWSVTTLGVPRALGSMNELESLIGLAQTVISCSVCCFLLTHSARAWFNDVKEARAAQRSEEQ